MRALLGLVVAMGVLIVAGTAVVAVTIIHRMGHATPHPASPVAVANSVLDEPPGTRIIAASGTGDRLALVLQGGGPDRVVLLDPASGQRLGQVSLAH